MSIVSRLFGWIRKQETSLTKILARIDPVLPRVEAIVLDLHTITAGLAASDHVSALGRVATYLTPILNDVEKVAEFVTAHDGNALGVILRDAAALIMQFVPGGSLIASDINLAIELAVAVVKEKATPPVAVATALAA